MLSPETRVVCGKEARFIKDVREDTRVSAAAGWGEVGETNVADVFVEFEHQGPLITITTCKGAVLRCSPEQSCFGRLNPMSRHYSLYLMERSSLGFRIGMSQDLLKELFATQSSKNESFEEVETIEKIWIIEATESLPKAVFMEKLSMFKYGIPNVPFSGKQAMSDMSDEMIRELFNRIDTPRRAKEMLLDAHMFEEHPHVTLRIAKSGPQQGSAIQLILFGGSEKKRDRNGYSHLIRIDGTVQMDRNEQKQFKRRMSNRGLWHLEVTREDPEEAQLFVKTLSCLDNLQIVKKIQLSKKSPFYILPASHLKPGMTVPIAGSRGIEEDMVSSVQVKDYKGPMYNLKIAGLFNFIAGEWVVMSYDGSKAHP